MRVSSRSALLPAALTLGVGLAGLVTRTADAGNPVALIVLREHGVGSAGQAQPYLDKLIALTAQQNGWDAASKARYETTRSGADTWVKAEQPHYGIFSLPAFLALKGQYNLEVVGQATLTTGGGRQYFIVSASAADLAGCKGKRLASDHVGDARFIEKIVAEGSFKLADFTVLETKRPGEAGRRVVTNDAECALIDDAQMAELAKIPGAAAVKKVWASKSLPPLAVVAFPSAPAAEKSAFQQSLNKICTGSGQQVCADANIQALSSPAAPDYAALVAAY
jgi:hypothetical protein